MPRGPLLHQRPAKALDVWLAIYYAHDIFGYKWQTRPVRPVPPEFYVAALLLLSLPTSLRCSIFTHVLRALHLHRVRAQLPARHLQQEKSPARLLDKPFWNPRPEICLSEM